MSTITFNSWAFGLDLRKGPSTSDANRLRVLKNAYITNALTIRQRPGFVKVLDLEPGTYGLFAGLGRLNTFQQGTDGTVVSHGSSLVVNNALTADAILTGLAKIHYGSVFNGALYVVAGYSGFLTPPPPPPPGKETILVKPSDPTAAPSPPPLPDALVRHHYLNQADTRVLDANCPQRPQVTNVLSKIYCLYGDVVRYTKTNDPRDWTTASDAGFLPVGLQSPGSKVGSALGKYQDRLVVFFPDGSQVWQVDPDPALNRLVQNVDIGTVLAYGHANMAGDVFFQSPQGVRTITKQVQTENLIDSDVGSPIDRELIAGQLIDLADARGQYVRALGQYWLYSGNKAVVFTFSRTSKVSAWSYYEFGFSLDYVDELDGVLYVRSGDAVYRLEDSVLSDAGTAFAIEAETSFVDFKQPGVLKQIHALDAVVDGTVDISHRYDPRSPALETSPAITVSGDTRPGNTFPVELVTTNLSTVFRARSTDGPVQIHLVSYLFDSLGSM